MRLTILLFVLSAALVTSCNSKTTKATTEKDTVRAENILYTANWTAETDLLGSSYSPEDIVIADSLLEVNFTLKQKEEGEIVFIELICSLDNNLSSTTGITLSYKCETPLLIKLSQSDFGKDGDQSYAHYQYLVPASDSISTVDLNFSDFVQPGWTPEDSKGKAMKLENVDAIYLTPNVDSAIGGSSLLGVKGLFLLAAQNK